MRVFLAGATGVIGTPLVLQLLGAGHKVTAMTRSVLRAAQLEAAGADPVVCDVFDADGVQAAMAEAAPEAVIDQLTSLPTRIDWGDPHGFDANNRVRTEGTRVLVDAALAGGARRVVSQSIAFAYAPTGDRVKDENAALFTDAPPPLGDVVAAVAEALERGAPGTYNIVDDEPAPQPEWLPVLARALRADQPVPADTPPPPFTPEMSLRGASNAKAQRELGWRPRYASWREGFAASLA